MTGIVTAQSANVATVRRRPTPGARYAGPFACDFSTNTAYMIDTGELQRTERLPFVQSAFVDNSKNPCAVSIGPEQGLISQIVPGRHQAWLPIAVAPQQRILVATREPVQVAGRQAAGLCAVTLANWIVQPQVWKGDIASYTTAPAQKSQTGFIIGDPPRYTFTETLVDLSNGQDISVPPFPARLRKIAGVLEIASTVASFVGYVTVGNNGGWAAVNFVTGTTLYQTLPQLDVDADVDGSTYPTDGFPVGLAGAPNTATGTLHLTATYEVL